MNLFDPYQRHKLISSFHPYFWLKRLSRCLVFSPCLFSLTTFANPTDPCIISGSAQFSNPTEHVLYVHAKDQTIIHWKDFSIQSHELTKFIQPSKQALVLNKVKGENISEILGKLEANGQILLINSNGILFGCDATIDTGGFIASTLDVESHKEGLLFKGNPRGPLINYGTIKAWDGDITLIGRTLENHGRLEAREGHVNLGTGQEILLKKEGEEQILIRAQTFEDEIGIHNTGFIAALQVELKADGNPYSYAIKQEGTIDALNLSERNGHVILSAEKGVNLVAGKIFAPGGEVRILGEKVGLIDTAFIDVSHEKKGGTVLVGGSYQGKDPTVYNSQFTTVLADVTVRANGLEEGHGGTLIFWSNGYTRVHGTIEAQGGPVKGGGGFIEISGLKSFDVQNLVSSTQAPHGKLGTLLLDPEYKVTISAAPSIHVTAGPIFDPYFRGAQVNIKDIQNALTSSHVIINSFGVAGFGDPPGAIILDSSVNHVMSPAATGSLTLNCTGEGGIHWNGQIIFSNLSNDVTLICHPTTSSITFNSTSPVQSAVLQTPGNIFFGTASTPCKGDLLISSQFGQEAGVRSTIGDIEIHSEGSLRLNGQEGDTFIEAANDLSIHIAHSIDISCPSISSASSIASTGNTGSIKIKGLENNPLDSINIIGDGGESSLYCLGGAEISIQEVARAINVCSESSPALLSTVNGNIEIKNSNCSLNVKGGNNAVGMLYSTAGNITIDIGDEISLSAGNSRGTPADSLIQTGTGAINLTSTNGSLTITGGVDARGGIISDEKIAIEVASHVLLKGGISNSGCDARAHITSNNRSISLETKKGEVHLIGGKSLSQTEAQITSLSSINIAAGTNFMMEAVAAETLVYTKGAISITASTGKISLFGSMTAPTVINGTGGVSMMANTTFDIKQNCTVTSLAPITLSCGKNFTMRDNGIQTTIFGQSVQITSTKGSIKGRNYGRIVASAGKATISAGNNISFSDYFQITQSGMGGLMIAAIGTIPEFTGNITFNNAAQATSTNGTAILCAGSSVFLKDTATINTMGPTTILTDNLNPDRIGPGGFRIAPRAQINTSGHPLAIYTAKRSQNTIDTSGTALAKTPFTESPQYVNTTQQLWGVFYPEGEATVPFTIFYKEKDLITIAPGIHVSQIHFNRIIVDYIGPFTAEMQRMLHPFNEFISEGIHFKESYQNRESSTIFDEQENFIRRPSFQYHTLPSLPINNDIDTSF